MAMDYVPGVGMVDRATGKPMFSQPGEGPTDHEAASANYFKEKKAFEDETHWRYDRDYNWRGLYGSVDPSGSYTPSFGSGMNDSWGGALGDRLINRKRGMMDGLGHFESKLGTSAEDYQRRIYARNNAIEDMYRQGYSKDQIDSFLKGEVDRNDFNPDWSDYNKAQKEFRREQGYNSMAAAAAAMRGEEYEYGDGSEFWGDSYFKGGPGADTSGGSNTSNPMLPNPNKPDDSGLRPKPDVFPTSNTGGGFLERYTKKREELANKPSIKSLFKDMIDYE